MTELAEITGTSVPAVSLLLPVFNGERYLEDCIRSVLSQTLTNFELLIGDDSSSDRSLEIARAFSDPRVRLYCRTRNCGLFKNLNDVAERARAPVLHFLCQDDAIEPECLAQEISFFAHNPSVAMSFCKASIVDARGQVMSRQELGDLPDVLETGLAQQFLLYYGCIPGSLSTVAVRTGDFRRVGGFDESFNVSGDYDLWGRLCSHGALGVVHERLLRLRRHPGQLSAARPSRLACMRENRRIRAALLARLPETAQSSARWYVRLRQDVLDTHCLVRFGLQGRFLDCRKMIGELGLKDLLAGFLFWCLTANNHLWKPTPKLVSH